MKPLKILTILLVLLVAGTVVAPWKEWVERGLKSELNARGIHGLEFTVSALSPEGITLKDITFGDGLTLDEMTVAYKVFDLARGQLNTLNASRLAMIAGDKEIIATDVALVFNPADAGKWNGTWAVGGIEISKSPYPVPPLAGAGDFTASTEKIDAGGKLYNDDKSYHGEFNVDYKINDPSSSYATITRASLPWSGGTVSVKNGRVTFAGNTRFSGNLAVEGVLLDALLRSLTGDKANATGVVAGSIPLAIEADGTPIIKPSTLSAAGGGQIVMASDAIPGDNEQLGVLRGVLGNFQYKTLAINLASDGERKLSAKLVIEGSNPDMYEGRPVKLNVQLKGDVLDLLRQSVPALTDPGQLLKQGEHAKP